MELNEEIFQTVKKSLEESTEIDPELFLKICTGNASKEEHDLTQDFEKQLQESCSLGYKFASEFDKEERFSKELEKLNEKIDYLIQILEKKNE